MSKSFNKKTVELAQQPSRIRREPPVQIVQKAVRAYPTEREVWTVVIGVILFAIAISIIMVGVSDATAN
ncbi:MAG TPA: hypothetical protein VIL42_07460 [Sphingomicrobium sp.]